MRQYNTLRRHCRDCGKEFDVNKNGRLCGHCKYLRHKNSVQKYAVAHKDRKKIFNAQWSKKNPDKNREKARRYLWKKKLKILISQRAPGHIEVAKERAIKELMRKINI